MQWFDNLILRIRKNSREQYRQLVHEGVTDLRIWIQEHGEQALLLGILFGAIVVLSFKFVFFLVLLAFAILLTVFLIALPQHEMPFVSTDGNAKGTNEDATSSLRPENRSAEGLNGSSTEEASATQSERPKGATGQSGTHSIRDDLH